MRGMWSVLHQKKSGGWSPKPSHRRACTQRRDANVRAGEVHDQQTWPVLYMQAHQPAEGWGRSRLWIASK